MSRNFSTGCYFAAHDASAARTEKNETLYDVAKRIGAIGVVQDGPSDLSTEPCGFESFGRE